MGIIARVLVTSLHLHNYCKTKTEFPYISLLPLVNFCLILLFCFVFNFSHLPSAPELLSRTDRSGQHMHLIYVQGFCAYAVLLKMAVEMYIMLCMFRLLLRIGVLFFFKVFIKEVHAHF